MRSLPPLLGLVVFAALAGCDGKEDGRAPPDERAPPQALRQDGRPAEARPRESIVLRGWIDALNRGDYELAARYFARGAIVDQGRPIRLRDARAAELFNATLPCRADLVDVDDEPGPRALASFRLRAGPGGPCSGTARVRVTVRAGRFTRWRQLPERVEPSGPVV